MTDVSFYLIPETAPEGQFRFACKLIEKIYLQDRKIFVLTESLAQANQLNDLLWTFHDTSFIPHDLLGMNQEKQSPVQVGYGDQKSTHQDVLINLKQSVPDFYNMFARVVEIVIQDDQAKALSREKFKRYKDEGIEVGMVNLVK